MALNPAQNQIFDLLVHQEEMISELYDIFSKQFPEHASFWKELSLAETRHAELLSKFRESTTKEQITFDEGKITITTLNAYLVRLNEVLDKAKKGQFTIQTALSCAVDYESSLVEKKIFSLFDSPDDRVKKVLGILQEETEKHVEYIKNIQRSVSKMEA